MTADEILRAAVARSVHDMRTPLSCIGTALEILRLTSSGTADHERTLEQIRTQVDLLADQLNTLSEMASTPPASLP